MARMELFTTVAATVTERWVLEVSDELIGDGERIYEEFSRPTHDDRLVSLVSVENYDVDDEHDREFVSVALVEGEI